MTGSDLPNPGPLVLGVSQETANQIGQRLREAREAQRLAPSTIAAHTKIREPYLSSMERGAWNELPPGLNGRGLVRIYAKELHVPIPELESAEVTSNDGSHPSPEHAVQVRTQQRSGSLSSPVASELNQRVRTIPRIPLTRPTPVSRSTQKGDPSSRQREPFSPFGTSNSSDSDITTPDIASILGIPLEVLHNQSHEQSISQTEKIEIPEPLPELPVPTPIADVAPIEIEKKPSIPAPKIPLEPPPTVESPTVESPTVESPAVESPITVSSTKDSTERRGNILSRITILAAVAFVGLGVAYLFKAHIAKNPTGTEQEPQATVLMEQTSVEPQSTPPPINTPEVEPTLAAMATAEGAPTLEAKAAITVEATPSVEATPLAVATPTTTTEESKTAELQITKPVSVRVVADGKQIFSGIRQVGTFSIKFNKNADIYIENGANAKLVYDGWNHGILGQNGRKRRIVLNASEFTQDTVGQL